MAFTRLENDMANISKLSDRPNQNDGLSAAQLKGRFDKAGVDIKDFINDVLIEELESKGGADNIGSTPLSVGGSTTVGGQLRELNTALESKVDSVNIYTKTNLQTEGQAVVHWGNLIHVPNLADGHWKTPVANKASLPLSGNELGDNRVVLDDGDGKQAVYTCVAVTGDMATQWAKIGDVDWNSEEATRVAQENQRVIDENLRKAAEESRVSAELLRVTAENTRLSNETVRVNNESIRVSNELERVALYNNISNMLATGQLKGEKGDKGDTGEQGIQGPKGDKGDTGPKGDKPAHRWIDTSLQIENPDGTWGDAVNLKGDKGDKGEQGEQGPKGDKGDTGEPGTSLSLKVSRQYDTYEDLPVSADIGYMCLVGSELHIYTENGWVNAGKLTKIDYDLFMHIDGGLFTDESGVEIGESGLEALQNHIIDANTHANLIIDGMEV